MSPVPYKQTDARWAKIRLGFGTATIGQGSCAICCIGYLHSLITGEDLNPSEVNKRLQAKGNYDAKTNREGMFSGSSIVWANVFRAFPELKFVYRDYNYLNSRVWAWINVYPRIPVLVECLMAGSVSGKHWRLFVGGGKCYNPMTGMIESTGSKICTGSARYQRA